MRLIRFSFRVPNVVNLAALPKFLIQMGGWVLPLHFAVICCQSPPCFYTICVRDTKLSPSNPETLNSVLFINVLPLPDQPP
jgi:hypothetical protein